MTKIERVLHDDAGRTVMVQLLPYVALDKTCKVNLKITEQSGRTYLERHVTGEDSMQALLLALKLAAVLIPVIEKEHGASLHWLEPGDLWGLPRDS